MRLQRGRVLNLQRCKSVGYGFEHEPEEGGSDCLFDKNRRTLEALTPTWTEMEPFEGTMDCAELRSSSWTWTPWGR